MSGRILLVTSDDALVTRLQRLAAAASVTLDVRPDAAAAGAAWATATAVLLGADAVAAVVALGHARRDQVHVVVAGTARDELFRLAVGVGAHSVLEVPASEAVLGDLLGDLGDPLSSDRPASVVLVLGASGGVGATVLSAALAQTSAVSGRVTMVADLDPWGPGMGSVLGLDLPGEHSGPGVTWQALSDSRGRLAATALRESLRRHDGVGVLDWGPAQRGVPSAPDPGLVSEVLDASARGHDVVVLDPGRREGWTQVLGRVDHIALVSRTGVGAVTSTARALGRLGEHGRTAGLVVRAPRDSPSAASVAAALGVELLAELPDQRRLDEHLDLGLGPTYGGRSALARTASALLAAWGLR